MPISNQRPNARADRTAHEAASQEAKKGQHSGASWATPTVRISPDKIADQSPEHSARQASD